jgi:hypothetical protein
LSQTAGNAGGTFAAAGTAPASGGTFALTTNDDTADTVTSARGSLAGTFKFTGGNEEVTAAAGTLESTDVLLDGSTTDSDSLSVTLKGDSGGFTAENIEKINVTTVTGGTAELSIENVTGTNNITVSGSADLIIDGFAADVVQPTIELTNFTRQLTVKPTTFQGTTKLETAEAINLSVSGTKYGTTTATQSSVVLDGVADGSLETLNIASTGSASNEFALSFDSGDSVAKINFTGATPVSMRAAQADVSGLVVAGATGSNATVKVNMDAASAAIDAVNFSGVNLALYDATPAELDDANATLKDGAGATLLNNAAATTWTVQGALYTALAGSAAITLDNSKADTGVTVASLGLQNVKAITVTSSGNATEDLDENEITSLTGDFSTVTINGDTAFKTSLTIDGVQTASGTDTARTVTVSAAGLTGIAYANITTGAASTVTSYSITGSANDDTLSVKNTSTLGATLIGGAGDDDLTGALGADTINGGDGEDTINITFGADKVTGGAGIDTLVITDDTGTATAQVTKVNGLTTTLENGGGADIVAEADATDPDLFKVTIDGVTYTQAIDADGDVDADIYGDFYASHAAAILSQSGVTVTVVDGTDSFLMDFAVADIGQAVEGDYVQIRIDDTADYTVKFTRSNTGSWASDTTGFAMSVAGTEVTVTNAASFVAVEHADTESSIAARSTDVADIDLGTAGITGPADSETAVTISNNYLNFAGRADGASFTVSSSFVVANAAGTDVTYSVGTSTTAGVTAPDTNTTITDFASDDVLDISLISGDVELATSLTANNIEDANVILLTTGVGYATVTAAESAVSAAVSTAGAAIVVFLNSTTGKVQAYYDADVNVDSIDTTLEITQATLLTFDNLTSLVGISTTFSEDSFVFA